MNTEVYESLPTSSVSVNMTAGAFAGIMEHCVMYPLDSIKTRMQALTPAPGGETKIKEFWTTAIQKGGVGRLIRGMNVVVVGAGPAHALYFSCYEFIRNKLLRGRNEVNYTAYAAAASVATVLHDAVMNPAETVKQRLQMHNSAYKDVITCIKGVYKNEGLSAFYRSYTTQLVMNVPFQVIHFTVYEVMQKFTNPERTYSPIAHMISGGVAGAFAAAVTTPFDVCKTLLNTQSGVRARGLGDAIRKVYEYSGVPGYFRGISARVLYQIPATAICWSTYEFCKYIHHSIQGDVCGPEADNDSNGTNQNPAASSRSSRFQDIIYQTRRKD
ncbi:mitoferrin-1 isoform X2 [Ptiloglossa arizonensis]|uniref:mitoferrin-1 isoform X2 n=1 Tax=Ptiloglossa arizonensis TaxID=3350558 RepID=UPI003FA038FB